MNDNDFILKTHGLGVAYGRRTILQDVNLLVRRGEFWFLLGPNGVGKTTLLKALLGMLAPEKGDIFFHPELARRRDIGFVPQRCDLHPTLPTTVSEFVLLGLAGVRFRKNERQERLDWALGQMDLAGLKKRSYWALSGGQRQRALVARGLIRRPKLLMADEPTKDLDLSAADGLMESLTELNRRDLLTILFVAHDLTLAARYCTHTALFLEGTVKTGICHAILNSQDLEKAYDLPVSICQDGGGAFTVHIQRQGRS